MVFIFLYNITFYIAKCSFFYIHDSSTSTSTKEGGSFIFIFYFSFLDWILFYSVYTLFSWGYNLLFSHFFFGSGCFFSISIVCLVFLSTAIWNGMELERELGAGS